VSIASFSSFLSLSSDLPAALAGATLDLEHVRCNIAAFAMEETDVPRLVQPRACTRRSVEMYLGTERSGRAGETGSKVEAINPPARAGLFRKAKDDKGRELHSREPANARFIPRRGDEERLRLKITIENWHNWRRRAVSKLHLR